MPQEPRPAVRTVWEAEAAGNTAVADVDQQLLIKIAGGDSLPHVPLHDVTVPHIPHPDVPLPEARADVSVGEE